MLLLELEALSGPGQLIYEDNQACISISEGESDKKRTKHIAKHYHFVREAMKKGLVILIYCKTAMQVAGPERASNSNILHLVWPLEGGFRGAGGAKWQKMGVFARPVRAG